MLHGIDVSNWQGSLNWGSLKSKYGLAFGITKVSEGTTYTDPFGRGNLAGMKANGLVRGVYHFARPGNSVNQEADHFVSCARAAGWQRGDLVALDIETNDGRTPAQVASWCLAWCRRVEAALGVRPIVYTFLSYARGGYCAGLGAYPLWIADPSATAGKPRVPTGPWSKWAFHQYSDSPYDLDLFNGDTTALRALAVGAAAPDIQEDDDMGTLMNIDRSPAAKVIHCPAGEWTNLRFDRQWQPAVKGDKRGGDWAVILGNATHAFNLAGDAIAHLSGQVSGQLRTAQYVADPYKLHEANPTVSFSGSAPQLAVHASVAKGCHRYVQIRPDVPVDVLYCAFMGFYQQR